MSMALLLRASVRGILMERGIFPVSTSSFGSLTSNSCTRPSLSRRSSSSTSTSTVLVEYSFAVEQHRPTRKHRLLLRWRPASVVQDRVSALCHDSDKLPLASVNSIHLEATNLVALILDRSIIFVFMQWCTLRRTWPNTHVIASITRSLSREGQTFPFLDSVYQA